MCKELIGKYLLNGETVPWILLQHFGDEVLGGGGEGDVFREGVVTHLDAVVGGLHIVGLERWPSHQAGVGNHSQTPDVHFIGVSQGGIICIEEGILSRI